MSCSTQKPGEAAWSSEEIAKMQSLCVFGGLAVPAGVCALADVE